MASSGETPFVFTENNINSLSSTLHFTCKVCGGDFSFNTSF